MPVDTVARARLLRKLARHSVEQARSHVLRSRILEIRVGRARQQAVAACYENRLIRGLQR